MSQAASAICLAPEAAAAGFRLIALEATPSTNDEALDRAEAGDPGRLWIVADEQKQGRGRHGRVWSSPPGNLYSSLLLIEPCDPAFAPQLGFVAGLALHDAVAAVTGLAPPRLALKWPNDLLLDQAKLAGILLEGHRVRRGSTFCVVIGMGTNIAFAPTDTPYPAACLNHAVGETNRATVFAALSRAFAERLEQWGRGANFSVIREAWLMRAAGIGGPIRVRLPTREAQGTFAGMDGQGRLLLDAPQGRETIDAGDLFFGAQR